tara:strand:+ start:392 stop:604 length:213 start_codon:yes stop_codon:yes gene_type:complete
MWKVLVVICTIGNPCTMFVEEPVKYYHTEQECMVQAKDKARAMTDTMVEFGYYIDSEAHACQYVDNQKST